MSQRRVARVLVDTAPLRLDRDYRWLWTGQAINGIGTQITRIALPYQVYVLTGSTLAVAALTAAQLIPILVFALGAGSVADAVDRRKLLLVTQLGLLACSVALVGLSLLPAPPLVGLFAVAFAAAGLSAVDQPARSSAVPRLVPAERLPSAIALNQLNFQVGSVVGPAIGGALIATVGLPGAYVADVLSFTASIIGVLAIAPLPPLTAVTRPGLAAIREGLRFVAGRRLILSTFVIDLNAMIFGMPTSLFPALALDVFKVGPGGLGLLAAAPAVGAFLGALLSGWVSGVRRTGLAVIIAVVVWGAAIALFGLSTFSFALALVFLAIAGAADVLSAVFRSTIVQLETPDELRGRVTSIHILVVTSGPRVGDIEAATVGAVIGPQLSVVSGGLLCVAGVAVVARLFPELAAHVVRNASGTAGRGHSIAGGVDSGSFSGRCRGLEVELRDVASWAAMSTGRPAPDAGARLDQKMQALPDAAPDSRHRVLVVGGGFGGLYAAKSLSKDPRIDLTIVDRRNFHLFQPLLYQVATGALSPGEIAQPLRSIFRKRRNTTVLLGQAVGLDAEAREVRMSDGGPIRYDTLIVAAGAHFSYFGNDEWARHAPGLKSLDDALEVRRRILIAFEAAEREHDAERRKEWMRFVVVGGGPTGVELAGALGEIANDTLKRDFRSIDPSQARIILVEAMERILPPYPPDRSASARKQLERLGVEVRTGTRVVDIDEGSVKVAIGDREERWPARTVLWAAGVQVSSFVAAVAKATGAEQDRAGRIVVAPDLTIPGHPEIFVVGDAAVQPWKEERPTPGVAQGGIQGGSYASLAIRRRLSGKPVGPFRYSNHGDVAVIGRLAGVTDIPWMGPFGRQGGFIAWALWLLIHISYLIGFANRVVVVTRWGWSFFTHGRGSRLITGEPLLPPIEEPEPPA